MKNSKVSCIDDFSTCNSKSQLKDVEGQCNKAVFLFLVGYFLFYHFDSALATEKRFSKNHKRRYLAENILKSWL